MQWTEEQLTLLRKWYGKIDNERLARRIGKKVEVVRLKASRLGLTQKRNFQGFRWTEEKVEALKQRYPTEPARELAKEFGCHFETLRHKAATLGIRCLTGHKRGSKTRAVNNRSVDIHYFDQWSPNMAYILGFLFADGSISKRNSDVVIAVASKDEAILDFIKKETKSTRSIYIQKPKVDKEGYQHSQASFLYLSSQLLVKRLSELGLKRRKTYTDEPFPDVPPTMLPHFVRGYFDGDGSASVHRDKRWPTAAVCHLGIIGSPKFMEGLQNILVERAGMTDRPAKPAKECRTPVSRLIWTARADLKKFYAFAYPPGFGFCLERKRRVLYHWLTAKPEQNKGD